MNAKSHPAPTLPWIGTFGLLFCLIAGSLGPKVIPVILDATETATYTQACLPEYGGNMTSPACNRITDAISAPEGP